jgi:hypothetical protein
VGAADDFVVDIGEVLHEVDLVAELLEPPLHDVHHDDAAHVPHMGRGLRGQPAGVHRDRACLAWYKRLLTARQRVVEDQLRHIAPIIPVAVPVLGTYPYSRGNAASGKRGHNPV